MFLVGRNAHSGHRGCFFRAMPEGPVIILLLVRYGFSDVYAVPPFLGEAVGVELVRGFPILCWMETKHFKAHVFYDSISSNMRSNTVFLTVEFGLHVLLIAIFDETAHEGGWNARRVDENRHALRREPVRPAFEGHHRR